MKKWTRNKSCIPLVICVGLVLFSLGGCATTKKKEVDKKEVVAAPAKSEIEEVKVREEDKLKQENLKRIQEENELARRKAEEERMRLEEEERKRLEAEERMRLDAEQRAKEEEQMKTQQEALPQVTKSTGEAITALSDIYFDYDKSGISSKAATTLQANADWLLAHSDVNILVEGHCDERGTTEYNLALGERRALATKQYLMSLGVSGEKIHTISYGEEMPLDKEQTEAAWAKNRRAHISVVSK